MTPTPSDAAIDASGASTDGRRTQGARSAATRAKILDATVACLVADGHAGTSTAAVQARAGVSRGALMHHFPSKQDLLLDAVAHLAVQRGVWLGEQVAALPDGADRRAAGIALLWQAMSGPLFAAATELWIAARTDAELRGALRDAERRLGRAARDFLAEVLHPDGDADDPTYRAALDHVLQLFRGAALTAILRDDPGWEQALVARATRTFASDLAGRTDPHTAHTTEETS